MSSSILLVVAAVIIDPQKRVLISERPYGKNMAGYWEFPGGKVKRGESPEQALSRELEEELGIKVEDSSLVPITFASYNYRRFHLLMPVYLCPQWERDISPCEHQNLSWVSLEEFANLTQSSYKILPADIPLIEPVARFIQEERWRTFSPAPALPLGEEKVGF
jgi:8-oxo-dGTP diphosphatase